ncbi:OTU4 [Symbiodinium pilosum]|uniref:Ubiquitin thioesterase OTU n=1 Tax=Symbiodinium pilosum TaxID=2952 RepID=A0A812WS55_SYMPI|nr:OTU4 [Symbiodinium pilosum]
MSCFSGLDALIAFRFSHLMAYAGRRMAKQAKQMSPSPKSRNAVLTGCLSGSLAFLSEAAASMGAEPMKVPGWRLVQVRPDGNCLFRAVAQGEAFAKQIPDLPEEEESRRCRELRALAVAELINRREDLGFIVEGDFDKYVARMSRSGTWGGEPELFMLAKFVLQMPLEVYITDGHNRVQHFLTYSEDLPGEPVRVLFHGYGHYEALVPVN